MKTPPSAGRIFLILVCIALFATACQKKTAYYSLDLPVAVAKKYAMDSTFNYLFVVFRSENIQNNSGIVADAYAINQDGKYMEVKEGKPIPVPLTKAVGVKPTNFSAASTTLGPMYVGKATLLRISTIFKEAGFNAKSIRFQPVYQSLTYKLYAVDVSGKTGTRPEDECILHPSPPAQPGETICEPQQ